MKQKYVYSGHSHTHHIPWYIRLAYWLGIKKRTIYTASTVVTFRHDGYNTSATWDNGQTVIHLNGERTDLTSHGQKCTITPPSES